MEKYRDIPQLWVILAHIEHFFSNVFYNSKGREFKVEFGCFIKTLRKGIKGLNQNAFAIELLNAAKNAKLDLMEEAVKSWLRGGCDKGGNKGYEKYFTDGMIDEFKFTDFLKNRMHSSWTTVQADFRNMSKDNLGNIIDCYTNDVDVFFLSILKQFKEIVGLPYNSILINKHTSQVTDKNTTKEHKYHLPLIKKLFLIDGLAGTGKYDLIEYINNKNNFNSAIIRKFTTRTERIEEKARSIDLELKFIPQEEFAVHRSNDDFYYYSYEDESYGFYKIDIINMLKDHENVFLIVRNRSIIQKISFDFKNIAVVVPIFIYSDRSLISKRLMKDGYNPEQIKFRLDRSEVSFNDYLEYPDGELKVIINNSEKSNFYRKINSLLDEFSVERIDLPNLLFINPSLKFELLKPIEEFKNNILRQLTYYPYEKNILLMMKREESNDNFYDFIKNEIEQVGFNCVHFEDPRWNISGNRLNHLAILYCCKYCIVLFDGETEDNFNVAYKLGIMQYQGKRCLIIKKDGILNYPFDFISDKTKTETYSAEIDFLKIFKNWIVEIQNT